MWSRLEGRGLVIALGVAFVVVIFPTPVPRHAVQAWSAAQVAAHEGDTLAAAQAIDGLRRSAAWVPAVKSDAIRLALANGDAILALELLDRPPSPMVPQSAIACWYAEAQVLLGGWEEATHRLASIDTAACAAPGRELKALARQGLEAGNLPLATSMLEAIVSVYPADVDALSLLGACLALDDPEAALSTLRLAESLGDPLAADLAASIDSSAGDATASLSAIGEVFLQRSLWPLASEAFGRLVAREPENAAAHAYHGLALDQQALDGLPELETAARLDPSSAVAQSLLGLHWQLHSQPQKAIGHLESAVELEPENSAFRASLAAARAEAGDLQAAIIEFQQAAQVQPAEPVFWALLAAFSIDHELELANTGLPAARNALALESEDAGTLDRAGYAHFLLGDRVTAERLLLRSLAMDPASASARLHYGLLLSEEGRLGEARAQLTSAARLGRDTSVGDHALRALAQLES